MERHIIVTYLPAARCAPACLRVTARGSVFRLRQPYVEGDQFREDAYYHAALALMAKTNWKGKIVHGLTFYVGGELRGVGFTLQEAVEPSGAGV